MTVFCDAAFYPLRPGKPAWAGFVATAGRRKKELWPGAPEAALEAIRRHHERPGGAGYPLGLADPGWPALLVAACDAVSAMLEDRPYRPGPGLDAVLAEIARFAPERIAKAVGEAARKIPGLMAGTIEQAESAMRVLP